MKTERGSGALRLGLPDPWLSSGHASLSRKGRAWCIFDRASKNGTFVNGERVESQKLEDGDVLEIGSTFLVYRSLPPGLANEVQRDPEARTFSVEYHRALEEIALLAPSNVPVLLCGETGSGKEIAARRLHALSSRQGPFLGINCAAIAGSLAESELFGHRKGAFSGALDDHPGLFRAANGGTLLLDEVTELHPRLQAKLLRVLQEREVLPVGGTRPVPVDVRIVSASSRELKSSVNEGRIREDLFARLAGHEIPLPALRERTEDLGLLVGRLLLRVAGERASSISLQREAVRALYAHSWPNNIRELEQALGAAVALAAGAPIGLEHLPKELDPGNAGAETRSAAPSSAITRQTLERVLGKHRGNVSAVARELGKARVQIRRWCKRFEIDPETYRDH